MSCRAGGNLTETRTWIDPPHFKFIKSAQLSKAPEEPKPESGKLTGGFLPKAALEAAAPG